ENHLNPGGPGMGNCGNFHGGFSSGIQGKAKDKEWIYLFSLPIKESEIIDFCLGASLKNEVFKIMPVQKQTCTSQCTRFKAFVAIRDYNGHIGLGVKCSKECTRFKAFVAIRDYNGHIGLGVKCSKEVATAICRAIILAKLSIVPVCRGYWGNKIGKPHIVPCKVTGHCNSVLVHLILMPRGTGIVSAPVPKKPLMMAGIDDCYTSARGCTATLGNFGSFSKLHLAQSRCNQNKREPYLHLAGFLSDCLFLFSNVLFQ
uniref:Small ribosomal subunit protein uS5 n=1 Tax=Rhinopithecus bieti TaxID=61621 RepID=A0A2K6MQ45_RHIBE